MPRYISILGKCVPAKERVVLKNTSNEVFINPSDPEYSKYAGEEIQPGAEFIYEGPDRKAMCDLHKEGVDHFGQDFRKSPDFLELLRKFNFKNEKEYFKFVGFEVKEALDKAEALASKVTGHELPAKVAEIKKLGGGNDTSGEGNIRYGGFGTPSDLKGA